MHYAFFTTGTWQRAASFVRLRELGAKLLDRGVRVSYVVDDLPYNRNELKLHPRAEIHFTPNPTSLDQLRARRSIIRELAPDFFHVLNPSVKSFLALAGTNVKVVGDWDEWPARRELPPLRKAREKFLDRWLRRRASRIVVASKYLQQQFKEQFNLDALYLPYAAYLQTHTDGDSPFTEPTAVYMGNLYPAYDHDLLFVAAKILRARNQSPRIEILGSGPDLEKWQAFVATNQLDNVHIAGFVEGEQLWRHLRHAHVLLFPIRDTLLNRCRCPSKTFAYARARRPIIANRVGEVAEVLGDRAKYVDETPAGFADALCDVMNAPRSADVDYGVERHNWGARADALLSALNTDSAVNRNSVDPLEATEAAFAPDASDPALDYGIPLPVLPVARDESKPGADHSAQRSRRFIWSIVTSLLTRPLAVVISLVSAPLFLTYLGGKEGYGLYESIGALAVWLGMTNAGMSLGLQNKLTDCYVTGDKELARRYVSSLMFALPVMAVIVALLLSVITPLVPWGYVFPTSTPRVQETAWAFWWAGIVTLLGVIISAGGAIYCGYQEIVRNNMWDAAAKIATIAACVGVVFTPLGVTGAILATAGVPTLVRTLNLFMIFAWEKPFLRPTRNAFDWRLLRMLLVEGGGLLVLQLSAVALFQTDKLIIGVVKGPAEVTEFSLVGRLYFTAYAMFVLLIGPLWPTAAEAIRRGDIPWVRRALRRSLLISFFGMLAVGIGMYFFGEKLVSAWTRGAQPTISRPLVIGLTVTFIARCFTECQSTVLNSASVLRPQALLLVSNAVLNCIAAVILVYYFGAVGAAWSIPITTLLTSAWMYPLLIRKHIYSIRPAGIVEPNASSESCS